MAFWHPRRPGDNVRFRSFADVRKVYQDKSNRDPETIYTMLFIMLFYHLVVLPTLHIQLWVNAVLFIGKSQSGF